MNTSSNSGKFSSSGGLSRGAFHSIDVATAAQNLESVVQCVRDRCGRVELVRDGQVLCVVISPVELQSLEEALEILSRTKDANDAREQLTIVAERVMESFTTPAPLQMFGGMDDAASRADHVPGV